MVYDVIAFINDLGKRSGNKTIKPFFTVTFLNNKFKQIAIKEIGTSLENASHNIF